GGGIAAGVEETGERQEAVLVGLGGGAGDGAAGFGRHMGQVLGDAGGGAAFEIETETELVEQSKLEAGERGTIRGMVDEIDGHAEKTIMRIALGQEMQVLADELGKIEPL